MTASQGSRGSSDSLLDHSVDSEEGLDEHLSPHSPHSPTPSPDNVKHKKKKKEKDKKGGTVMNKSSH